MSGYARADHRATVQGHFTERDVARREGANLEKGVTECRLTLVSRYHLQGRFLVSWADGARGRPGDVTYTACASKSRCASSRPISGSDRIVRDGRP